MGIIDFVIIIPKRYWNFCTIYNNIIFNNPYYLEFFFHFQMIVHLTGIIPMLMLFLFLETSYYETISIHANILPVMTDIENPIIRIDDENPSKSLSVPVNEIITISSMDNYLKVVMYKNREIQKSIVLRGTLKNIEKSTSHIGYLIKCHRSHIVNLNWVQKISGNSLNKKLHMKIGNIEVPISRKKIDEVILKLNQLN